MIITIITLILIWWIFKPFKHSDDNVIIPKFEDLKFPNPNASKEDNTIKVKLIEPKINPEDIESSNLHKNYIFRPKTLEEYIGQEKAKEQIKMGIEIINKLEPIHFLISGKQGCGKTTVAKIIQNLLEAKWIEKIATQIKNEDDVVSILNKINSSIEKQVILFMDEIHGIKDTVAELFYTVMEDF